MTKPLLLFDLDGTLVDSARDLIPSLNAIIATEGLATVAPDDVGKVIGHGARAMIERAFALNRRVPDTGTVDRLFDRFLLHYEARISRDTRPYPGAISLMDRLAAAGWRFAVCTNKMESLSRRLLGDLGLDARFAAICGGDTFAVRKPDAGHVDGTITRAGGSPARSILIGDSVTDRDAARNAGIPFVGVTFGYSETPMAALEPDILAEHFDEIEPAGLDQLLA